jgi:hypothetical protein
MGHDHVEEALSKLGDCSLIAKVNCYHRLDQKRKSFQELIAWLEDQLFMSDVE